MESGTYQPIIPNCMPSSYPSGRFSLIVLRTALSAARRSAGSAARYWATVEIMLLIIPAAVRGRELYGSVGRSQLYGWTGTCLGGRPGTRSSEFREAVS